MFKIYTTVLLEGQDRNVRNTYSKYKRPISNSKKVMAYVQKLGRRSHVQNLWFYRKDLVIKNTYAKYESPTF